MATFENAANRSKFGPWVPFFRVLLPSPPQSPPLGVGCLFWCVRFFLVHMNQNALWFQSSTSKKKMGRFGTFFNVGHSTKVHQVYKFYLILRLIHLILQLGIRNKSTGVRISLLPISNDQAVGCLPQGWYTFSRVPFSQDDPSTIWRRLSY